MIIINIGNLASLFLVYQEIMLVLDDQTIYETMQILKETEFLARKTAEGVKHVKTLRAD